MTDASVSVSFSVDKAAFEAGAASVKAQLQSLSQEAQALARSMVATGQAGNTALVGTLKQINSEAGTLRSVMRAAEDGITATGGAAHGAGAGIGFYFREVHYLMDELARGDMTRFQGTLMNVTTTFLSANRAMIPYAVGVGALAAAFGYLAYQAYQAQQAVNNIRLDAAVNNFQVTEAGAQTLRDAIQKLGNVSASEAAEIYKAFAPLGPVAGTLAQIMAPAMRDLARAMGTDVSGAAKEAASRFIDIDSKGKAYVNTLYGLTQREREHFAALLDGGKRMEAFAALADLMTASLERLKSRHDLAKASAIDQADAMERARMSGGDLQAAEQNLGTAVADTTAKMGAQSATLSGLRSQLLATSAAAQNYGLAMGVAMKVDSVASSLKDTRAQIATLENSMRDAPDRASPAYEQMARSLDILRDKAKGLQNQMTDPVLSRGDLAQYETEQQLKAARSRATQEQIVKDEIAANREKLKDANLTEQEKQQLTLETAQKERQLFDMQTKAGAAASKDQLGADEASIEGQIAHQQALTQHLLSHLDMQVKTKQISEAQKEKAALAAINSEQKAIDALYEKELALAGLTAMQKQRIQDKLDAYNDRADQRRIAAENQAAEAAAKSWDTASRSIESAFDGQISGLLRGTTSWAQAVKNVLATLTEDVIKFFVNWGIQAALNEAKQIALQASGLAAQKAMNATAISGDAGKAAAGAYAATTSIPIIGPVLAPAAAAAAYAGTMAFGSFAVGSWQLPRDMVAQVHQGEMIIPAAQTPWAQSVLANASGGSGAGGGDTHVHMHVNAVDSGSLRDWFHDNAHHVASAMHQAVKNGSPAALKMAFGR